MTGTKYRVLVGLRYPANPKEMRRKKLGEWPIEFANREPGEVVDDIPPESAKWLLADGLIEPVAAKSATKKEVTDG